MYVLRNLADEIQQFDTNEAMLQHLTARLVDLTKSDGVVMLRSLENGNIEIITQTLATGITNMPINISGHHSILWQIGNLDNRSYSGRNISSMPSLSGNLIKNGALIIEPINSVTVPHSLLICWRSDENHIPSVNPSDPITTSYFCLEDMELLEIVAILVKAVTNAKYYAAQKARLDGVQNTIGHAKDLLVTNIASLETAVRKLPEGASQFDKLRLISHRLTENMGKLDKYPTA